MNGWKVILVTLFVLGLLVWGGIELTVALVSALLDAFR